MKYEVFSAHEWIYPDSRVREDGCKRIELPVARGSYAACQILFNDVDLESSIRSVQTSGMESGLQYPEVYQLLDIFVEKNTGPVGFCVKEGESAEGYTTRQAPFRVYEALNPLTEDVRTRSSTEALYVSWRIPEDIAPGHYTGELAVTIGEQTCVIPYRVEVFSAVVPDKGTLSVINWFILGNMAKRYNLGMWSEEHWVMIRKYGEVMRRARQTHFWVPMEAIDMELIGENKYRFRFDKAERLIRLYLGLGFTGIEGGLVAGRQDFWGSEFVIWNHWNGGEPIKAVTYEGYAYLSQFLPAWRAFLEKNGWLDILIQHVADEPTENSKQEYHILSGIVRKFMPGVPLLEAVETFDLEGAVDIWIPKNVYYQEHREQFEKLRALGDKLWFYTCCYPGGSYLNRLWDMPLLRSRYLHWGNYKYDMEGFLHWGLNCCDDDKDPFNHTDIFFPPGDTHIVYPGANGPLSSMRFEAMRAGAEDYELLRILAAHDKSLADEIVSSCLISFNEANEDPAHFADAHRRLLEAVSEYSEGVVPHFETRCLHSLVKVFPDEDLMEPAYVQGSALIGEYYSFQIAYRTASLLKKIRISVDSPIADALTVRSVGYAPSELTNYEDHDDYLLRTTPGLYPDPLYALDEEGARALPNQWRSLWITVQITKETATGLHPIHIRFLNDSDVQLGAECFQLEVIAGELPEQELIHTEWFYLDCLATWYNMEIFSESHWEIIEDYLTNYVEYGMNMILTPLFSPPLEMNPGGERPTVQLIGVRKEGSRYAFDFSKLDRWIALCKRKGIKHFEFSHIFTQWGAKHAPKIMAETGEGEKRIFGWETDAVGEEYRDFLTQFIPELMQFIRAHGLENNSYLHISDEPWIGDMPFYENASKLLRSLIGDFPVIDALSDYAFYANGLLSHPVVSTEHIDPFIENNANNLWAYYCCCEYKFHLSNRFFNMPSLRTRIIGTQLYKFGMQGFLHWGYNHWYSQRSLKRINPYQVTDADHAFPSGDAFLVYPGEKGPIPSIRLAVMREAMQDIRALKLLEKLAGKDEAIRCLEQGAAQPLTFRCYEKSNGWFIEMRERVNQMIKERMYRVTDQRE